MLKLRKISQARYELPLPDPTRPATIISRSITHYAGDAPHYEAIARCDDGKTRTFVTGPDGRWVRKGKGR